MKKLLYSSIILGAGFFAFGIQGNNVLTVKAADEVIAETTGDQNGESTSSSTEKVAVETEKSDELGASKEMSDSNNEETVSDSDIDVNTIPVLDSKTGNRDNVSDGTNPLIQIKPREDKISGLKNVDDPANKGDLMVPYVYHGNAAVYKTNDGKLVLDDSSDTGYKMNKFEDIYLNDDPNLPGNTGTFTDEIYRINSGKQETKKEKMIESLKREAFFFMEFRNHGYSNASEFNTYKDAFNAKLAEIQSLNDDGTPVAKTPVIETTPITGTTTVSHHHSSSTTQSHAQANEKLPLVVVAIRQAKLYSADGTEVTDRGLSDASVWMVDEVSTINGQKMYRISANEWVAANDVI